MSAPNVIDTIRRRMRMLGLHMKGLSKASGNGDTYIRDLFVGKSKNPKTQEIQNVMDALDRLEAVAAAAAEAAAAEAEAKASKKGRA